MPLRTGGASTELRQLEAVVLTDAYTDIAIWTIAAFKTKVITFSAADESAKVITYYSDDLGLNWTELDAEFTVSTASSVAKTSTTVRGQVKITAKNAGAGVISTLTVRLFGTSLS
jgi:hypothetical protein